MFSTTRVLVSAALVLLFGSTVIAAEIKGRRIQAGDTLCITVRGLHPDFPVDGAFVVHQDGQINLGEAYGRVNVAGATVKEARLRIFKHLEKDYIAPEVACCDLCTSTPSPCQKALAQDEAEAEKMAKEALAKAAIPDKWPLTCTIRAESECELGKVPEVTVEIKNGDAKAVFLVTRADGSDIGLRFPECLFEVTGPDGKSALRRMTVCGSVDPLRESHFVRVEAGGVLNPFGTFTPSRLTREVFSREGAYRIRFVYSTHDKGEGIWWGTDQRHEPDEKLVALLAKVPKLTVESNEITVKVISPKK